MEQPSEYVVQEENKICHLRKAIYGLKQSPRAWFEKFSVTFLALIFIAVTQITLSSFSVLSLAW